MVFGNKKVNNADMNLRSLDVESERDFETTFLEIIIYRKQHIEYLKGKKQQLYI